ncbi:hypothetical protein CONLIGDRAFT_587445, partial [Coniochaeta ligniaria NRRL 30616]
ATPTPTQPGGMVAGCTKFYFIKKEDTCSSVLTTNGLTIAQLFALNAGVKADCSGMWLEVYVCVTGPGSGLTSTTTSATTTTGGNGVATPTPTQPPSIVSNCNKFYFVEPGTSCSAVLSANGITVAQLFAWNSGVGADCAGMWASVWLCVGVIGGSQPTSTSKTTTTSTTSAGNGISTPSPTQPPSIVSNCNKFYFVEPGTSCSAVLSTNGITVGQLFAWNSGVGADCSGMWASVWLCVGVIGGSQSTTTSKTTTSTTTAGNGITTPSPTQPPSIVSNCNKFYFVQPGTACSTVPSANGITQAQLFAWNSGVNADCSGLWASVWVCVGVIGGSQPTTTSKTTSTTTTKGNGVATPTPTQPGMVTNCRSFYKVADGDNCDTISTKTKVSVKNLQTWNTQIGTACNVWLGYYLCVAVL